jgi:predicted nucleic-acid-binding Zn-ribbon protein
MTREEAIYYLKSSGMSDEQIKSVIDAFTCEDYISRQEALKAMCDNCPMYNCVCGCSSYRHIERMASVTPQPKVGKWLAKSFHEVYCDNCGFDFDIMTNEFMDKMKYCPNCGAKMEVEE